MAYAFYANKMRHRIKVQRRTETENAAGGLDISWTTIADNVAAEVVGTNGREALIGEVLQGISYFQITVRHRTDLKSSDQIIWLTNNNQELNLINAEDQLGTKQWTLIQASTQSPQGA